MKKSILVALLALCSIGFANADPYVAISAGATSVGGTQAIAVGMDYGNGISTEVEYRNFNDNTASGNHLVICDLVVAGQCVASHGEGDTMSVKMSGIGATAKLALTENVYVRGGAFYHRAEVSETFAPSRGLAPASFTDTGFTPVVGIGATLNGFAVEVTSFGSMSPSPEGKNLVVGTQVSYTHKF